MKKLMKMVLSAWCLVLGADAGTAAELPDGYTVIEYLTVPYGAHIDTGYTANGQTKVVMDAVVPARWEQNDRFGVLFGSRTMTAWTEKAFALQMCDGNTAVDTVRFAYNGAYRQDGGKPFSFGERVTVTCDGQHVEWTGSKAASVDFTAESLASSKSTLYIFADNTVAADGAKSKTGLNPSVMQLYSFKIYEGGTLKRDFVPVLNEKGERGMIDLANNNEFHPLVNDYAGQSIARVPAIVVPKGAFIDTGIKPDSETRVTMDVLIDRGESWYGVLEGEYWFGCWDEDYNKGAFAFGNDGTGVYAGYGNQGGTVGSVVADGRHTVELDGNKVKVDGADYHSFTNESFALKQNLYLFAQNRAGFQIPFVSDYQSRIICMGCKIYHGGKLVRDYVPARMALIGAPYGLYDRVEGVFHGREGAVYYTNADSTNLGFISSEISASATLMYRRWDKDSNGLVFAVSPQKCTFIDKDTTELKNDCWYAAVGDVTLGHGLILNNSVHLILTDGCYLESHGGRAMAGIEVEWGTTNDKLHIYGQEGDTGRLVAWGDYNAAGIGGRANSSYGSHCGEIYIHGGKIEAYGDTGGAGIGGGRYAEVGYSWGGDGPAALEVYGGEILAVGGSWSAGIGGGGCSSGTGGGGSCGSIAIFGGVVEATGGVGIGPGLATSGYGTDMDLKISGGRVVAYVYDGAAIKLPSPDDLEIEGSPVSIWNSSSYLATAYNDGDWLTISREPVGTRWNPWRIGTTGPSGVPNGDVWAYREDDSIICNGQGSISTSAFLPAIALSGLDVKAVKKLVIGKGITAVEGDAFTLMGIEKPVQLELPGNWPADDRPTSIYVPWRGGHFYTRTYTLTIPSAEPLEITEVVIDGVAQKELPASGESVDYVVCAGSRVTVRYRFAGRTLEETQTIGASGPDGEWIPAPMTSVSYLDAEGNECQANAMVITERTKMFGDSPWAVALLAVTNQVGLAVASGSAANLILADGAALAADLSVPQGSTLNVYCQTAGTGGLKAIKGSGGAVTIYGGCLGVRPLDVWIPGGRKIVDNPDPSLRTAYPYAVKPGARDCTVTIGQHWRMDAFWTYGDGTETNAVEGVSFRVSEGAVGVKVIFRPHACFAVVGSGVVELEEMPGADVVFGEGNDYRVPDVICTLTDIQDLDWDAAVGRMTNAVLSAGSYEVVGPDTVSFEGGKWYVAVKEEVITTDHVIEVAPGNGSAANLMLMDGASLTVSGGIGVDVGKALNIYGQSDGGGKLIANGSGSCAGIGGRNPNRWRGYGNCGTVMINGGTVTATSGNFGAGIGGGEYGAGGVVTINGGTVTATGNNGGAGIGGGNLGADGDVTLDETKVEVVEGAYGNGHPYVKIVEKAPVGPTCEGGEIEWSDAANAWVVTPTGGVTAVTIAGLPEGAKVAVPPTVKQVGGVPDEQIKVYDGETDVTARYLIHGGVLSAFETFDDGRHYLESTAENGPYINTGYSPTMNTRIVADFNSMARSANWAAFFGVRKEDKSESGILLRYFRAEDTFNAWFCNLTNNEVKTAAFAGRRITVELKAGLLTIDTAEGSTAYEIPKNGTAPYAGPIYVFCENEGDSPRDYQAMRLYSFKIYDIVEGVEKLVRDLVPFQTTDGTEIAGLYDRVTEKCFVNQGGGTLTLGHDDDAVVSVTPGVPVVFDTADEAANAAKKAELRPSDEVAKALGGEADVRAAYCAKFGFDVVLTSSGKWAVMAALKPEAWSNLVESAQAATRQIDVAGIAALELGVPTDVTVTNCVPGFYYTIYGGSTVTNLKALVSEKSRNVLCELGKPVKFSEVVKPSDAAGFFSIGVKETGDVSASAYTQDLALALGLVLADTTNPLCKLTEFNVTGNRVSGRIATICDDEERQPGDLARVVLWGTRELGKPFVRICEVRVEEDGSFSQQVDGQYRFFKVSIEPRELLR